MNKRNQIRWMPFESIFHSKEIISEIETKKNIHQKPTLSEDELDCLSKILLEAIHTRARVKVLFYYNGQEYIKTGKIITIENNMRIFFEDHSSLYFEQILNLELL